MNGIKQISGTISKVVDLSPSAREVFITLSEPLTFEAGAFVNFFMEDKGEQVRRAFSISTEDGAVNEIGLSIRHTLDGRLTPVFWERDVLGAPVRIMGPLGLNTADKMKRPRTFLFGFGIGAGVMKSLASHMISRPDLTELIIVTGSREVNEIVHKGYFDQLAATDKRVKVKYVVSGESAGIEYPKGYIQHHLGEYNFSHADIYICGQEAACEELQEVVEKTASEDYQFFVEGFH